MLHDEVGGHHAGGPGPAHHTVDHDQATTGQGGVDERGGRWKISDNTQNCYDFNQSRQLLFRYFCHYLSLSD